MLGIGCPDRHPLPLTLSTAAYAPTAMLPSRESGFVHCPEADPSLRRLSCERTIFCRP
jgi:hypothetical protein